MSTVGHLDATTAEAAYTAGIIMTLPQNNYCSGFLLLLLLLFYFSVQGIESRVTLPHSYTSSPFSRFVF